MSASPQASPSSIPQDTQTVQKRAGANRSIDNMDTSSKKQRQHAPSATLPPAPAQLPDTQQQIPACAESSDDDDRVAPDLNDGNLEPDFGCSLEPGFCRSTEPDGGAEPNHSAGLDFDHNSAADIALQDATHSHHARDVNWHLPEPLLDLDENENEDQADEQYLLIADIATSQQFTHALKHATHANSGLAINAIERLRNPSTETLDVDDEDLRLSLDMFFAVSTGSEEIYRLVREGILHRYPDSKILSYAQIKVHTTRLSGVTPILNDMCRNSCHAYTGPFTDRDICAYCSEPRYDPHILAQSEGIKKVPQLKFRTVPIGPFLQAQKASPQSSADLCYRKNVTKEILKEWTDNDGDLACYKDIFWGSDYLDAVEAGDITMDDMCLMFSIDSAQLYEKKRSDCYIYIWLLLDRPPDQHYKKKYVLPGAIIPGPNHPKNLDSFIFPGLYHLAAIQNEGGLMIWDALLQVTFCCNPFLLFVTADTPALADIDGMVGHGGKHGCCRHCGFTGRHKDNEPRYYYAAQKPDNYTVAGCDHPDWSYFNNEPPSTVVNAQR